MRIAIAGAALMALLLAIPSPARADRLSDAEKLIERGCYLTAEGQLEELTTKEKKNAAAWAALARCRLLLKDLDGAETAAYNALDIDEENAEYWRLEGEVAFEKGFEAYSSRQASNVIKSWFAESEAKFKQALKRNEKMKDIRWWLGWAKQLQEYPERARELYDEQIEMFPKVPEGYLRLGSFVLSEAGGEVTEASQKIRRQAVAIFDKGLAAAGPHAEILYQRGLALEWLRDKQAAIDSYFRAIGADPDFHKAWTRLYQLKVPSEKLLDTAKRILAKDKTNATAAMWCAFFDVQGRRYKEALQVGLPALKVHFEHQGLHDQLLNAGLQLLGPDPETATAAFAKLHEYYPFSGSAANNLGMYHRDTTHDYEKSVAWYLKAVEREPTSQDLQNDTGLVYLFYLKGQEKKALPFLLRAVSLVTEDGQAPKRGFWDACENLAKYYWEVERDPVKVIQYAKLRLNPMNGVPPYGPSQWANHYRQLAERELGN